MGYLNSYYGASLITSIISRCHDLYKKKYECHNKQVGHVTSHYPKKLKADVSVVK